MSSPGTGVPPSPSPTATLLERLARPYDPVRAVVALLGLPERSARQLVGAILATSAEAEDLLAALPAIVRSLSIASADKPTRCYGELRGPVLWSETMSSRSASAGDPGLYVCATTTKAYDTDENRVLTAAIAAIHRAGKDAEPHGGALDPLARRARANGARAGRFLEHQTLVSVPITRVSGRSLRRTRAGSRRTTYRPALELLRRAGDPLASMHLELVADDATLADHALLASVLQAVEDRSGPLPPLRTARGELRSGPVRYRHRARRPDSSGDAAAGVTVHEQPVRSAEDVAGALRQP